MWAATPGGWRLVKELESKSVVAVRLELMWVLMWELPAVYQPKLIVLPVG
jgi:hypothetical protein